MSYNDVMGMPLRIFWTFAKNISRIQAENDLRAVLVALCSQSPEYAKNHRAHLQDELGVVAVGPPEEIDHAAGIARLRQLLGQ
jgi:hypothetical protein